MESIKTEDKTATVNREQVLNALEYYIRYHIKPGDEKLLREVKELQHYFD
jgi:hypothetical protein